MRTYLSNYEVGLFEMDDIGLLCEVFDDCWTAVEAEPSIYLMDLDLDHARDALCRYIIDAALDGERSNASLKAAGLRRLTNCRRTATAKTLCDQELNSSRRST